MEECHKFVRISLLGRCPKVSDGRNLQPIERAFIDAFMDEKSRERAHVRWKSVTSLSVLASLGDVRRFPNLQPIVIDAFMDEKSRERAGLCFGS